MRQGDFISNLKGASPELDVPNIKAFKLSSYMPSFNTSVVKIVISFASYEKWIEGSNYVKPIGVFTDNKSKNSAH